VTSQMSETGNVEVSQAVMTWKTNIRNSHNDIATIYKDPNL